MREFHECDCDSCAVNEEHVKQAKELVRLRARVAELEEGLAQWKDELQAKVTELKAKMPRAVCTRCDGKGYLAEYSICSRHPDCHVCDGTGLVPERVG